MTDPSGHVPPQVLPHIHLVSSHRFPTLQQLPPDNAVEFLLQAPRIVKDVAPMSWQYFQQPPNDGTVFLTWQPPQRQLRFSSDGYLWVDPEATFRVDVRGFTLEILVHQAGIRYQLEPMCMHRRYRYRIINKIPAAMGTFDPSLWIVHYSTAEPQHRYPAQQIQVVPEMQKMFQDRQFIEKQGQLLRKDFMLHDRLNWPKVEFAPAAQMAAQGRPMYPGAPQQQMAAMNRHPQYMQHQAPGIGPSPAKRARQVPPQQLPGAPQMMAPGAPGIDITDEEDTTHGDMLDHLTAREISTIRYTQHHEWMEEIFSSPYAAGQILPIDLGFGLMGELGSLTEGLFDAPNPQAGQNSSKIVAPKTMKKLEPAQFDEFKKRVANYQKAAEDEIEALKAEHAKKLADLKRTKTYVQAERRLRDAEWDANTPFGTDGSYDSPSDRSNTPESRRKVAQVISDVEKSLKIKIGPRKDIETIEKGGLMENQPLQVNGDSEPQQNAFPENGGLNGLLDEAALDADNTAASLLDQFTQNSLDNTPGATLSIPAVSQPESLTHSNAATPGAATVEDALQTTTAQPADDFKVSASADSAPITQDDTMDLDVDIDVDLATTIDDKAAGDDWVMVDEQNREKQEGDQQQAAQTAVADAPASTQPAKQPSVPAVEAEPTNTVAQDVSEPQAEGTPDLFDASEFDGFDNLDTTGDALVDAYGAGDDDLGLDLDNSAFGEAFQAGETHQSEEGDMD